MVVVPRTGQGHVLTLLQDIMEETVLDQGQAGQPVIHTTVQVCIGLTCFSDTRIAFTSTQMTLSESTVVYTLIKSCQF